MYVSAVFLNKECNAGMNHGRVSSLVVFGIGIGAIAMVETGG